MKNLLRIYFFIFFINISQLYAETLTPPKNSWEHWIQTLRKYNSKIKSKKITLPRPDKLSLTAPLPLWVDCHLSWSYDHGEIKELPKELILRANETLCAHQLEEW